MSVSTSQNQHVAVIGLGSMGFGMATSLKRAGHIVTGCDVSADAVARFPATVGAITVPTLILYGTADGLCPPAGSEMLAERIGSADTTVKAYEGLFHEILNEPERDAVMDDMCSWLRGRIRATVA